ncbi:uncharacterized protein si:dkeyp-110g5.4 [Chanos chanos]|uniref:Uncharacterized protein si:dkeyp-110g5.4 n=1 Tax=Chanos chanos TaxID=29144 RepID=A0A6J2W524_CHACN|nr:uncharacterized protein LOC115820914 [Chanos chanos]
MSSLERTEVYVPKDAKVQTVPVKYLPASTARQIGLLKSLKPLGGSMKEMPQTATWISPVVIREKKAAESSDASDTARSHLTSQVKKTAQGRFQLPVTTSNLTAFRLLRKFVPVDKCQSQNTEQEVLAAPLTRGRVTCFGQDAIILYNGQIYLSLKKDKSSRKQWRKQKSDPEGQSVTPVLVSAGQIQRDSASTRLQSVNECCPVGVKYRDDGILLKEFGITQRVQVTLPKVSVKILDQKGPGSQSHDQEQEIQEESIGSLLQSRSPHEASEDQESEMNQPSTGASSERPDATANEPAQCSTSGEGDGQGMDRDEDRVEESTPLDETEASPLGHEGQTNVEMDQGAEEHGWHGTEGEPEEDKNGETRMEDGKGETKFERDVDKEARNEDNIVTMEDENALTEFEHDANEAAQSEDNIGSYNPNSECLLEEPQKSLAAEKEKRVSDHYVQLEEDEEVLEGGSSENEDMEVAVPSVSGPKQDFGFDFEQSEQEEKISRIRARLREREAALNTLLSQN